MRQEKDVEMFVAQMRDIADEVAKTYNLTEWGVVKKIVIASSTTATYDVALESDPSVVIPNVVNQSDYSPKAGDEVLLFLAGGTINNAFIMGVRGHTSKESSAPSMVESADQETIIRKDIKPETLYTLPCRGSTQFYTYNSNYYGFVPCVYTASDGTTFSVTAWWKVGQPFDGFFFSRNMRDASVDSPTNIVS